MKKHGDEKEKYGYGKSDIFILCYINWHLTNEFQ